MELGNIKSDTTHEVLKSFHQKFTDTLALISSCFDRSNSSIEEFGKHIDQDRSEPPKSSAEADFAMNVIINGVSEDKDPCIWCNNVDNNLECAFKHLVIAADVQHVGSRYKDARTRPILVKLTSVWDRRIVLGESRS